MTFLIRAVQKVSLADAGDAEQVQKISIYLCETNGRLPCKSCAY